MKNKFGFIITAFLLMAGLAFAQTANVQKGTGTNNLTGTLNTGTQTITANDGGTITYSGTGTINSKTLQTYTPATLPVSTATQTALGGKVAVADIATEANLSAGTAGKVIDAQLLASQNTISDFAITPEFVASYTYDALNVVTAHMAVDDDLRILYTTDFSNNEVSAHDISDPANPVLIGSVSSGAAQPRAIAISGNFLFVVCAGGQAVTVINRSNPAAMTVVQTAALSSDQGKNLSVVGDYLYIMCFNAFEKWRIVRESPTDCYIYQVGILATGGGMAYDVQYNGAGYFSIVGENQYLCIISEKTFTEASATVISGTSHGTTAWYGRYLLIANATGSNVLIYDCKDMTAPVLVSSVTTRVNPEQIQVVGDRAYVASLTISGANNGGLDCIDLSDIATPVVYKTFALHRGTGFIAQHRNYLYVSTHYGTEVNIEIVKVETPKPASTALQITDTPRYVTKSQASYDATGREGLLRVARAVGMTVTLPDPSTLADGIALSISNVGIAGWGDVTVTNAFNGWDGLIPVGASVHLKSTLFGGVWQWDNVGAQSASLVSSVQASGLSAVTVQSALEELSLRVSPSGNVATASALETARTINGVSFDGTANITVTPPDASAFKHKRVTTGSIGAGSTALVTVTWTTPFADANYTVSASVVDSTTTSLSLSVVHVESVTANDVTVRILNNAVGSLTGTLHVIAVHD